MLLVNLPTQQIQTLERKGCFRIIFKNCKIFSYIKEGGMKEKLKFRSIRGLIYLTIKKPYIAWIIFFSCSDILLF